MSKYGFRRVAAVGDQVIDLGWTHQPQPQPSGPLPPELPRVPRTPAAAAELRAALDNVHQLAAPSPPAPPPAPKPTIPKPAPKPAARAAAVTKEK